VEGGVRVLGSPDSNVLGHAGRESAPYFSRFPAGVGEKIAHLPEGVNSGIGPPRSLDLDIFVEHRRRSILQYALYGAQSRLPLPAVEISSVVLDEQFEVSHWFQKNRHAATMTAAEVTRKR
jgi:hypothetical protein